MSELLEPSLPAPVTQLLTAGVAGAGTNLALQLLTVSPGGWPHASMLSVGEVVVLDERTIRLALWPQSGAAANCKRTGQATLAVVVAEAGYGIRLRLAAGPSLPSKEYGELLTFDGKVEETRSDVAPYATLEGGIRFRLLDPAPVIKRWEATRRQMLDRGQRAD